MDWKPYYRTELEQRGARLAIESWLVPDAPARDVIAKRGVLSFPHTALRYAGPLQARVARAVLEAQGIERVLALGVLHGSSVELYRRALDPDVPATRRGDGFAAVRGGFLTRRPEIETPFGPGEEWRPPLGDIVRVDDAGLLAAEFSLDTFRAVLRAAADALGRRPLPVCPLFVGMTRDPVSSSFSAADGLADWLRAYADPSTAIVATGDLVHYGTAYGGTWIDGNPVSPDALGRALRPWVDRLFRTALVDRDWEGAYALSREKLGNDQREMLAALSSYLGAGAGASIFAFDLSDYSEILKVAPPCVVASALAAYRRAA